MEDEGRGDGVKRTGYRGRGIQNGVERTGSRGRGIHRGRGREDGVLRTGYRGRGIEDGVEGMGPTGSTSQSRGRRGGRERTFLLDLALEALEMVLASD